VATPSQARLAHATRANPPSLTCRLYNNIVVPSLIAPNSNYYLFKEGIKPAWEDSANAKGGKWSVQLPRGKFSAEIDQYWLFTVSQYFVKPPIPASC
jgi:hypothetical protein